MTLPFETAQISPKRPGRRSFIGGSDARIIMGSDEAALLRLWREKRGEAEPEDLSGNLIVQLGVVTEPLNRHWFERNTAGHYGRAAAGPAPGAPLDGGNPRRNG
jgi:predicted phage-related endonuclease